MRRKIYILHDDEEFGENMANIPAELSALPLESLIGKPLEAAVRAQAYAAMKTARFVQEVGLDPDTGQVKSISPQNSLRERAGDGGALS